MHYSIRYADFADDPAHPEQNPPQTAPMGQHISGAFLCHSVGSGLEGPQGSPTLVKTVGATAFVATTGVGLQVVDLSAVAHQNRYAVQASVGTYKVDENLTLDISMALGGLGVLPAQANSSGFVLAAVRNKGLVAYDVTSGPAGPVEAGYAKFPASVRATGAVRLNVYPSYTYTVSENGALATKTTNLLLMAGGGTGLMVYEVVPNGTAVAATLKTVVPMPVLSGAPITVYDVVLDVRRHVAYLACYNSGVCMVDMANPYAGADRPTPYAILDADGNLRDDRILGFLNTSPGSRSTLVVDSDTGLVYVGEQGTDSGLKVVGEQQPRMEFLLDKKDAQGNPIPGQYDVPGYLSAFDGDRPRVGLWVPGGAGSSLSATLQLYDRKGFEETRQVTGQDAQGSDLLAPVSTVYRSVTLARQSNKKTDAKYNFFLQDPAQPVTLGMIYDPANPDTTLMVSKQSGSLKGIATGIQWHALTQHWGTTPSVTRTVSRPWVEWTSDTLVEQTSPSLSPQAEVVAAERTRAAASAAFTGIMNYNGPRFAALNQPRDITFNYKDANPYYGPNRQYIYPATLHFLKSRENVTIEPRSATQDGFLKVDSFTRNCRIRVTGTAEPGASEPNPQTDVYLVVQLPDGRQKYIDSFPITVFNAGMAVDYNRDGNIEFDDPLTKTGPDHVPDDKPFEFWLNDNYDIPSTSQDADLKSYEQDEAQSRPKSTGQGPGGIGTEDQPDCDLPNPSCERDLEDFARLHVRLAQRDIPALNGLKYKLYFTADQGQNPMIKVFTVASNPNGQLYSGEEYLNDAIAAVAQLLAPAASPAPICIVYDSSGLPDIAKAADVTSSLAVSGRLAPFLFDGVQAGKGSLVLAITDTTGLKLAQFTIPFRLKEITEFYDDYTVGDNELFGPGALTDVHTLSDPPVVGEDYILAVHGWNWDVWQKERYAQSVFKRLFWLGYKGRFGSFRWPDTYGALGIPTFDFSEYHAYQSGLGLNQLMNRLKGDGYKVHLYAHSQGNVVAGEALREAGLVGGDYPLVIDSYTASQAALPARMYDPNYQETDLMPADSATTVLLMAIQRGIGLAPLCNYGITWPDLHGHYPLALENGQLPPGTAAGYFEPVKNAVQPGMMFNFYNPLDYAVGQYQPASLSNGSWLLDQFVKPYRVTYQLSPLYWLGFKYGSGALTDEDKQFFVGNGDRQDTFCLSLPLNLPLLCRTTACYSDINNFTDPNERFKMLAFGGRSRSRALGGFEADLVPNPNVSGFKDKDLQHPGNFNMNDKLGWSYQRVYHGTQFRSYLAKVRNYWAQFMENLNITHR